MNQEQAASRKGARLGPALRKGLPWMVTAGVFVYVFHRVPVDKVLDAALHVNLRIFLPVLLASLSFAFFWEVLVYTLLFRWFGTRVTYREMMPVRGAVFLLILLNFFVGQGGMALLMNRWKKLSVSRATSVILFSMFNDYYLILAFCLAGAFQLPDVDLVCFFRAGEEGDLVRFVLISWLFFTAHIAFYRLYLPRAGGMDRIKKNEILSAFREAPTTLYFKLGMVKSVGFIVGIVAYYYAFFAVGLHVPFLHLLVMLPMVWLIGSIPITVMGLGTVQAAMIWLVARFAQGSGGPDEINAAVVALSLLWSLGYNLGRFAIGAVCVSRLPKNIWKPKAGT